MPINLGQYGGPPREPPDIETLSRILAAHAADWVPKLFPRGRLDPDDKTIWRIANIHGEPPRKRGSCIIHLAGAKAGGWFDYEFGKGGEGPASTIKEAFGISGSALVAKMAEIAERYAHLSTPPKTYTNGRAKSDGGADVKQREALNILRQAVPLAGTLGETYLRSRGITIMPTSGDLLFNDNITDFDTKTGEPGLVGRYRAPDGTDTGAVHCTYLKRDGSDKAARKMLAPHGTAVIMLGPPDANGALIIGEGIESTLAAMQLYGLTGGWACADAGGLTKLAGWFQSNGAPNGIKRLLVCADRGAAGEGPAREMCAAARKIGLPCELCLPRGQGDGADFNDDLRAGLEAAEAEPEVFPPEHQAASYDEIAATISKLSKQLDMREQRAITLEVIEMMAPVRLDAATESQCLTQIRSRTIGMDAPALRKSLKDERRRIGFGLKQAVIPTGGVSDICARYIFVKKVNAFWDRQLKTIIQLDAVRHAHWSEMPLDEDGEPIDPRDIMLKGKLGYGVDKADLISFLPGADEIFEEDGATALNMWTPPDIAPELGDVSPFLDHITYLMDGDAQAISFLLDYFAHLIQFPAIKIKSAILIIGVPGIGKSMIGEMISKLIGQKNTTSVEESDLRSSFNEWMDGIQLVIVHELMTIDRQETMGRLKSYITDPWLRINRKNVPTYQYRNRANFLMFSNHEDAARIERGDRRYFAWISLAEKQDKIYYAALSLWFANNGAEYLLHYLQHRDLSNFDPNAAPPNTIGKDRIASDSRNATEAYLQEAFDAGSAPFQHDLIVANDVIDYLMDKKKIKISPKMLSVFLRHVGGSPIGQKRLEGRRPMVWAIRDAASWELIHEDYVRHAFRDIYSTSVLSKEERDHILGIG